MRVVSLTCSNTEIVCALDCADLLVGVDDHSDHPPAIVARLPRVGPDLQIDVARVAALRPDLVLASLTVPGHERVVEALEAARLPWMATEPVSLDDVYADVATIARVLGVGGRAEGVVRAMRTALGAPSAAPGRRPSVLVEWWPKPVIVPGGRSWVAQMLAAAGACGPLDDEAVKSRPITDDEVRTFDPDAVVIAWCGVPFAKYRPDVVRRRPAWRDLRAIARGHVYCIAEAHLGRPGPRLVDGVRDLRRVVRACGGAG
ncbi:MAG: ABC transporter substrate-binding protein [bacterium]|nr:ABC transporter substrate-binding protein [bacterium]